MYTLEKHLELSCIENPQYEILSSIWKLNKKHIPLAQSAISFNFPHYSLHEKSHSDTIIKNIESFLGEERIKKLSQTDTWMLLMAAYTHDLGMVVFHSALEEKWVEENFQEYLIDLSQNSTDQDLNRAAHLLLEIENQSLSQERDKIKLPLEIRKAVILIIADFFRKSHHIRSREMIKGEDKKFSDLMNGFNLNSLPNRFSNVLADIAFSHGTDFYSILERIEYQSDGFGTDKMHPRFIAYMLRLGDLLDIDDKRFNVFSEKVLDNSLPKTSGEHKEKHASTKHLLISPESIEATVDCKTDEVYRIAREWFDWLQIEVESQSREWSNIAPRVLFGMPPTISKGKLKVLYNSAEPKKELMNLRFAISNKKVFEMFEGSAIYENAEFVFLRELVQNSIDASKIQLWKFITSGLYDHSIREHLNLSKSSSHEEIISSIIFPSDLPDSIYEAFQINLNIDWADKDENFLRIEITDSGTGISEGDLIRMTQKVGESRSQNKDYNNFKKTMPYWLQPTGAFGIGLQSLFLLAPSFIVQTKAENEEGKEIIFQSAKKGEYSRITPTKVSISRGTKVIISIPKNRFSEVFSERFNMAIIDSYDFFSDKFGDIYMHKMKDYIETELQHVDQLNVKMFNTNVLTSRYQKINFLDFVIPKPLQIAREEKVSCSLFEKGAYSHPILFSENIIVGSDVRLMFYYDFGNHYDHAGTQYAFPNNDKYYVRDIPVDEKFHNFYACSYCSVRWNLQSPVSDKILNISRDKLIKSTRSKFEQSFLTTFFPIAVKILIELYEKQYGNTKNTTPQIAFEYFHMELTASMLDVSINSNKNIYDSFQLPVKIATSVELKGVAFPDFFASDNLFLISKAYKNEEERKKETMQDVWGRVQKIENITTGIVLWDERYFSAYLKLSGYFATEYKMFDENGTIVSLYRLQKKNIKPGIELNDLSRNSLLNKQNLREYSKRRSNIFPVSPYFDILAVDNVWYDGFGTPPKYSNNSIISPFKEVRELEEIIFAVKKINIKTLEEIKGFIKASYLNVLIPEKLINWIIQHSSNKKGKISREKILETYLDLIGEMIVLHIE